MKKFLAIILAICLMASLCVTAFAAETGDEYIIDVSGLKENGEIEYIGSDQSFEDGWQAAVKFSQDKDWMDEKGYVRIVVDLQADWTAKNCSFGSGTGFSEGSIYFPKNTRITLNLNGYTINRALPNWKWDGEVIYIYNGADVIINNGTITGGYSGGGAGGIHMQDAIVTLNDVNLVGNKVTDDDGAAIAVHDGGTLIMNGGCMSNNLLTNGSASLNTSCGTLYADGSTATLNDVTISGNTSRSSWNLGAAVATSGNSVVTLNNCTVENNGTESTLRTNSIFSASDSGSVLNINGGTIRNNVARIGLFYLTGTVNISNDCVITGNSMDGGIFRVFHSNITQANVENCTITDNPAPVVVFNLDYTMAGSNLTFTDCEFNNNGSIHDFAFRGAEKVNCTLVDCDLGDSIIESEEFINIIDSNSVPTGSIIGEGSFATVFSLASLAVSVAAIAVCLSLNKKISSLKSGSNKE